MKLSFSLLATALAAAPAYEGASLCKKTVCTYSAGRTLVSTFPGVENWHCEKDGDSSCKCVCHDGYKCTIRHHHTSGYKKNLDHCKAKPTPAPTNSPTNSPTPKPTALPTPAPVMAANYQKGTVNIAYGARGTACKVFTFPTAFASVPKIAVTVNHRLYKDTGVHDSMTGWSEWTTKTQFKVCGRELNSDDYHDTYNFDFVAWTGDTVGNAEATGFVTPTLAAGTNCWTRTFKQAYSEAPIVVASADHTNIHGANPAVNNDPYHDAISTWIEGITKTNFKICATESSYNGVGGHNPVTLNYIAFAKGANYALTDTHGRSGALAGGATIYGTACLTIAYGKTYATAPIVIATVNHATYNNAGAHDSFITWTENVGTSSFRFCGRESNFNDGPHDGATYVDWATIS